jgi:hypothetical protein
MRNIMNILLKSIALVVAFSGMTATTFAAAQDTPMFEVEKAALGLVLRSTHTYVTGASGWDKRSQDIAKTLGYVVKLEQAIQKDTNCDVFQEDLQSMKDEIVIFRKEVVESIVFNCMMHLGLKQQIHKIMHLNDMVSLHALLCSVEADCLTDGIDYQPRQEMIPARSYSGISQKKWTNFRNWIAGSSTTVKFDHFNLSFETTCPDLSTAAGIVDVFA